jgi:predicted outer membrane repeat protein
LNILSSKFSLNQAGRGGAIYTKRTVAVGSATIQGSEFFENKTTGTYPNANGAALLVENIRAIVTLTSMHNNSGQSGGAIYVTPDGQLELSYSTLRDNSSTNGGGVYNKGSATLESVTLARNGSGGAHGGGIDNFGTLVLENVTVSGNSATYGAGIKNEGGSATLTNVTLSNNQELNINGGAIFNTGGSTQLHMKNVLVANTSSGPNCKFGQPLTSNETNLSDDNSCNFGAGRDNLDDKLNALGDNGGSAQTHLPRPDSPAIDFGMAVAGLTVDQRGKSRPQGARFDVGAVEACSKPAKPTLTKPADKATGTKVQVKLKWNAADCAAKYVVVVKNKGTGKKADKFAGFVLKYKTKALPRGVTYEWFVKACNPPRGCAKSDKREFTIQ